MSRLIDADKLSNDICFLKYVNGIPATVNHNRPLIDIAQACECINKQPTIEVPQWIPCSERLPEDSNSYLVLFSMKPQLNNEWCEVIHFQHKIKKWKRLDNLVIAWQPLPSVWKGENNAEK